MDRIQCRVARPIAWILKSIKLALLALTLPGCLVVPYPTAIEPLPFDDEELSWLVLGTTSRQQVVGLIGEPNIESPGSALALYAAGRRVAGMLVMTQHTTEAGPVRTNHLLVLEYDRDDLVRHAEVFRPGLVGRNAEFCTRGGYCIKPHITNTDNHYQITDANFYDTPERDAAARSFNSPPGQCAIYLYLDTNFWAGSKIEVDSAGQPDSRWRLDKSGYFMWLHEPGTVDVAVANLFGGETPPPGKRVESSLGIDCQAGQAFFVRATLRYNWGRGTHDLGLSLDDSALGATTLGKRRLMLGE